VAHVQKRNQGGKTTWRARVRLPDGRERSRSFDRKVDAERWVVETQAQLNRGNVIDPRAGQITLAEYAGQWQAAQMYRPSTAEVTASRLRRHVLPTFGHRPIGSLRPSEIRAWVKSAAVVATRSGKPNVARSSTSPECVVAGLRGAAERGLAAALSPLLTTS
jgi:hypothetical protein